jgi:hypothetical protein
VQFRSAYRGHLRRHVEGECASNLATAASLPMNECGASDCRKGCGSHLEYPG